MFKLKRTKKSTMNDNQEYEQKTINVKSVQQFEEMSEELLKNWSEYKKLDSRMKLLDASVKKYMVEQNKQTYENRYGALCIVSQNRRALDRSLIEDIEKYKVDTEVKLMYKSPKKL